MEEEAEEEEDDARGILQVEDLLNNEVGVLLLEDDRFL